MLRLVIDPWVLHVVLGVLTGWLDAGSDAGIRVALIPERAPSANAFAERFVRSIKEECLDRLIPIGDRHCRRAVASPGTRQSTHLRPADDPDDESCATPSAARRAAQFL